MTDVHFIDPEQFLSAQLAEASPDLVRSMLSTFIQVLMGAEADAVCGAGFGQRSAERVNSRNGYRHRDFDTRAGTIDLAIPKLRQGSYFPDWLLEPRKRAEKALTSVVATCYLLGVSTRRMDKLVQSLGISGISKSQVSVMAKDLDEQVAAFRHRRLDQGPYPFVAADALVLKVREAGRVARVHALVAVGVNADGYREVLGINVTSSVVAAVPHPFHGESGVRVSKAFWPMVAALVRSVFEQPDRDATWRPAQRRRRQTQSRRVLADQADYLLDAADDILAFTVFPPEHWPKIRSNNPQERLNKEIRRRTDVVGIFPESDRRDPSRGAVARRADRRVLQGGVRPQRLVVGGACRSRTRVVTA